MESKTDASMNELFPDVLMHRYDVSMHDIFSMVHKYVLENCIFSNTLCLK